MSAQAVVDLPIGDLHAEHLGHSVKVNAGGAFCEGVLLAAKHAVRRDGSSETTLDIQERSGTTMSASWRSSTLCALDLSDPTVREELPDIRISDRAFSHRPKTTTSRS